jgi:subtilisin
MTSISTSIAALGFAEVMARVEPGSGEVLKYFAAPSASQSAALAADSGAAAAGPRHFEYLGMVVGTVDAAGLAALRADKRVGRVVAPPTLSLIRPVTMPPGGAVGLANGNTWGIDSMRIPMLWATGLTGAGVTVAHIDTGVDGTHGAISNAIVAFAEFDFLGNKVAPPPVAHDSGQHGTHTAGTIVGTDIGGTRIGVAPGARLASALCIEGGNVLGRVLGGMDWSISQGARVMSMSLGFRGYWPQFAVVIDALRANGVLPVIAAGNEGPGTSRSPGNYVKALSVGAYDAAGGVAGFSSSQRFRRPRQPIVPDICAPGVDVLSSIPGGSASWAGTSMATPHVAGLAALLMEANPNASINKVEGAIISTAKRPGGVSQERAGAGFVDAFEALAAVG